MIKTMSFKVFIEAVENRKFHTPDAKPIENPKVGESAFGAPNSYQIQHGTIHKVEGDHIHLKAHKGEEITKFHKSKVFRTSADAWPRSQEVK
jgi:hypothetical protein